ncbi:DUF1080 domain-containing protein [Sphingobium algorifonticola]|uniref:DUF1080 domain-containing protein n=2 Tax=Sphingobium algorifonticola TaxID=2008318 RepID=A0A437J4I0_9SPHN|nr:DUF1080 domain-containing protein [Sphingobium algorifonticola]
MIAAAGLVPLLVSPEASADQLGYRDTPLLPGQSWRVHDRDRPRPLAVTPGATPADAPADAIILFSGRDLSQWHSLAAWTAKRGVMHLPAEKEGRASGNLISRQAFGDVQLHLEYRTSPKIVGKGAANAQLRANSGILFMGRYELQILDSYESTTYADGQAAAIYGQHPPLVNASRRPGQWQTLDILFERPRFSPDGSLARPAYITAFHNGLLVHLRRPLLGATRHKAVAAYTVHADALPIELQDHVDHEVGVDFRNIWVRRLESIEP